LEEPIAVPSPMEIVDESGMAPVPEKMGEKVG